MADLKKEFDWYVANQKNLVAQYAGKVLAIKDQKVIGVYNDELSALTEMKKAHELGTFLIQKCEPGSTAYTQTYHSRVTFA